MAGIAVRDDRFTVVHQNMRETEMSVRDADNENDVFREAFEAYLREDPQEGALEEMVAYDFFKAGWEAAVRELNDDPSECRFEVGNYVRVTQEREFCWWKKGDIHQVLKVRDKYQDIIVTGGNCIDWDCLALVTEWE